MKLRAKMLVGFSILILILIGIEIYNLVFLQNTNAVINEIVGKKFETDKLVQEANLIVMKIHSDIWDAMLYGIEVRDIKKSEMQIDMKKVYADIRDMKEKMPERNDTFEQLEVIFRNYVIFGSTILEFKDIEEFKQNNDVVAKFKENKNYLISTFEDVSQFSSNEFANSLTNLQKTFSFANILMIILTFIAVLAGIITAIVISSTLTRPIYSLVDVMKEVEKDNYEVEAKIITKDEIGKLANTFNTMTRQIKISRNNLKDQERLKKEMEIAERIQTSLCPPVPQHNELEIAASMTPAEEVGGDYYDIIFDNSKNLWMAIGDVSGHGVTPGLVMMMAETAFNAYINEKGATNTPKDAIVAVNQILTENIRNRLKEKHFMTMNFLKYTGAGQFTHAGSHVDIIVYRSKTKTCDVYPTEGVYLGIVSDISSHTVNKNFELGLNDVLVIYTDGIIESRQKDNIDNLFGMNALKTIIAANGIQSPEHIMTTVKEKAMDWCGNKPDDDMSIVVVKRIR